MLVVRRIQIEPKRRDGAPRTEALRVALESEYGATPGDWVTVDAADAAVRSGLPLDLAEEALQALSAEVQGHLQVTEDGGLRYLFRRFRAPGQDSPWRARVRAPVVFVARHGHALGGVLVLLAGPWLALAATPHCILGIQALQEWPGGTPLSAAMGLLAMILFCVGALGVILLQVLPGVLMAACVAFLVLLAIGVVTGEAFEQPALVVLALLAAGVSGWFGWGFFLPAWEMYRDVWRAGRDGGDTKRFNEALLGFFVGARTAPLWLRDEADALADERRLTQLLRAEDGVLTRADLMTLFGWTPAECDGELTRILVDYGGDIVVTADGALLYTFDRFLQREGADAKGDAPASYRETLGAPPRWIEAGTGIAIVIFLALGLPLLGVLAHPSLSFVTTPEALDLADRIDGDYSPVILQNLGGVHYAALLALPLLRLPSWLLSRAAHRVAAHRAALLGVLERRQPTPLDASAQALAELGGTIDDEGRVVFPDAWGAMAAADALRAERRALRTPAKVVHDTRD